MRKELKMIEQIENYLLNQMESTQKMAFENEMASNPALKADVDFQSQLTEGIRQLGAQKSAQKASKKYRVQKVLKQIAIGVTVAAGIAAGAYFYLNNASEEVDNKVEITQSIQFPENDSLSTAANQYLDQEVFKINVDDDTVIETRDGVVVSIPANAFETQSETVDLVLQTAVKPSDVLQAGLSTTSNGEKLETGGMFYIDAFDQNRRVNLTKNLVVDVPSGNKKEGMQLYEGQKQADGEINWVNPKPVETFLTPVDILTLDFYPPGYEATLDNWGLYGKDFRDSLYYSFAFQTDNGSICDCIASFFRPQRKITVEERDFLYGDNRAIDKIMTEEEARILCENNRLSFASERFAGDPVVGEKLFKGNCASCHFPDRDMTGPALKGARERWIQNSTEDNFYAWIKNSAAVIASGDPYAKQMEGYNQSVMTPQAVTNEQIDHIFAYIEMSCGQNDPYPATDDLLGESFEEDTVAVFYDEEFVSEAAADMSNVYGVNPANAQTIWHPAFNETNLATKEFEERMPWIHQSCETAVLDVYLEYSYMPLYFADSIAATMTYGAVSDQFENFAARRDGRVNDKRNESLKAYYEKKVAANKRAIQEAQTAYWEEQEAANSQHQAEDVKSQNRSLINEGEIFRKEFEKNWEKVQDELGLPKGVPQTNPSSYTATVATLGWKNIDRKVSEATANRESTTFSYEGKESSITYESWSATVTNAESYDRINVYNIPKAFNSYIKLKKESGKYTYKLNADLDYQTLVLAWTEQSIYFFQDKKTKPGEHAISLKPITHEEFKYNVAASLSPIANMGAEMKYIEYAQKDQKRINLNEVKVRLREKIEPVVFPCMRPSHAEMVQSGGVEAGHHSDDHGHH